jgi:hypothetical protein
MKSNFGKLQVIVLLVLTVALGLVAVQVLLKNRAGREKAMQPAKTAPALARDRGEPVTPTKLDAIDAGLTHPAAAPVEGAVAPTPAGTGIKTQTVAQVKKSGPKQKVVLDPVAREALSLVGVDPYAELYWFSALNDPSLPQSERQDLVDDLNEEGLPDPKHPTIDDLPVLLVRIKTLETAMQLFKGDVYDWQEPYEDLTNLVALALGNGKPVR